VERALDAGIARLTLYAFSSDNWRRPAAEVQGIFWLLRAFLRLETKRLKRRGARLLVIGRRDRLPQGVLRAIEEAEEATAGGRLIDVCVAIDYSSREAIARAAAAAVAANVDLENATPDLVCKWLTQTMAAQGGEVDLLIRTGGEKRLSDFMLWECAYAELYFSDCLWPDFDEAQFRAAIDDYAGRQRRFGGLSAKSGEST
jgi:undecaprenyl diphosphate synthase